MSTYTHFRTDLNSHGVLTIWMDVADQAMNTLSTKVSDEMEAILGEIEENGAIKSVVLTSGKKGSFIAGADIDMLSSVDSAAEAADLSRAALVCQHHFHPLPWALRTHDSENAATAGSTACGGE